MKITFTAEAYRVTLKRIKENIKLAYEIYPYIIHDGRIKNLINSLSDKELINHIRFNDFSLIDKAIKKYPNLYKKLKITKCMVYNWKYRETTPSLNILIKISKLLNQNLYNYIPYWFKILEKSTSFKNNIKHN